MNIFQRAVAPQAQSLCFAEQWRQLQYSHQIHFRWFTSSTKSATIQRRIWVCDMQPTVGATPHAGNGPGGPNGPPGGPTQFVCAYQRRQPGRPTPPAKRLMSQIRAMIAATMKSQWTTNPTPKATSARIANTSKSTMSLERGMPDPGYAGSGVSTRIASPVCACENPNL